MTPKNRCALLVRVRQPMNKKASESFRVSKTDLEASRDRQSWASEGLSCLIRHDPVQLREGSVPPGLMSGPLGRKRLVRPESGLTKSEEEQMEGQKAARSCRTPCRI